MTARATSAIDRPSTRPGKLGVRARRFAIACFRPVSSSSGLILYPFLYTLALSFQRRQLFAKAGSFIGFDKLPALLESADFWPPWNGIVFPLRLAVPPDPAGRVLAVMLNRPFPGRGFSAVRSCSPISCRPWSACSRFAGC